MNDAYNADQAEVAAITHSVSATTVALYDERLSEEFEAESETQTRLDEQISSDILLDSMAGQVIEEIERRAHLLGDNYPFKLVDGSLVYRPSATFVYEYCLAVSTAPNITEGPLTELARYFEVLSGDIVCRYLGEGSQFIRSGFPPYPEGSTIRSLQDAINELKEATGEWEWAPSEDAIGDLAKIKDEGLDFVVWKSIDKRKGSLYVLGQCACGRTDWHEKHGDLNFEKLKRWVPRLPPVTPVRSFVTPHNVTASKVFSTLSGYAGLSFDRVRLTTVANSAANLNHFVVSHAANLSRLTRLVINHSVVPS